MSHPVSQQLGNYRLLRTLGQGGSAEVYLGEHIYLKRLAALKVLRRQITNEDAERFMHEAQTLSYLNHPNIVRVLDFAMQDHQPFLVMEYAPHGTLRARHPQGTRVPLAMVSAYVRHIATALQYAHQRHLIHRDIKPENMLLNTQDEILLGDFGIAALAPAAPQLLAERAHAGTTFYMAPEQFQGQAQPASDQYALGIVVYEWLCGRRPFVGTLREVALQHLSADPPPLREWSPDLPLAIEAIVLRALAKDPQQRFASIDEFAAALTSSNDDNAVPLPTPTTTSHEIQDTPSLPISMPEMHAPNTTAPTTDPYHSKEATSYDNQPLLAPAASASQPFWQVPVILTSLVGREQDISNLHSLLTSPTIRLLTLLGAGGIGKTRLSIQLANVLRDTFVDGVCFVELAAINDPQKVLATIASNLGLQDNEVSHYEQIRQFLGQKLFLLLLDNFEQVVLAAPVCADLLAACPHLKILVTSRVVLRVAIEHQFWLTPLAVPDLKHLPETEAIAQYSAIELFIQRARAQLPTFQIIQTNAATLTEICTRLDGMPLAIELAAARIKLLPPQALLPRLSKSLHILTKGMPTQSTRQQTLRNTIQWSYDLLDAWEQRVFRQCAIFVGGFTLAAVEALFTVLCAQHATQETTVLDCVDSLIDKSLLQPPRQLDNDAEPRLSMLETVREYGQECLTAQAERAAAQEAHAEYYLALAEDAEPHLNSAEEALWMERLERDLDNLRAAMDWLLADGRQTQQMDRALRLGNALGRFWVAHGYFREGWTFLEQALTYHSSASTRVQARALSMASELTSYLDDLELSAHLLEQSLALFQELGDRKNILTQLRMLGWMAHLRFDFARAHVLYEECLTLYRSLDDKQGIDRVLYNMGYLAQNEGDYAKARALFEETLVYRRETGHRSAIASTLYMLAQLLYLSFTQPPLDEIQPLLAEGLALANETGEMNIIVGIKGMMAWVAFSQRDLAKARLLVDETIQFCKKTGKTMGLGFFLTLLARINTIEGHYVLARTQFEEGVEVSRKNKDIEGISSCLLGLASLAVAQKQYVRAVRLWGAEEQLRAANHISIYPIDRVEYDHYIAAVRTFLGEKTFTAFWEDGRNMSLDEALAQRADPTPLPLSQAPAALPVAKPPAYPAGLSAREVDVLRLVAQGLSDAVVAERLVISPRTVTTHLTSIYNKLGVKSRAAATRFALEHHLC